MAGRIKAYVVQKTTTAHSTVTTLCQRLRNLRLRYLSLGDMGSCLISRTSYCNAPKSDKGQTRNTIFPTICS